MSKGCGKGHLTKVQSQIKPGILECGMPNLAKIKCNMLRSNNSRSNVQTHNTEVRVLNTQSAVRNLPKAATFNTLPMLG